MRMRVSYVLIVLIAVIGVALTGCAATPKREYSRDGFVPVSGAVQRGVASWYGNKFRGKKTASGEPFNPDAATAAHRTLVFGAVVEVRNLKNNRTVLVEINDRGPFAGGRIIDLSESAARELGMLAAGVVPVEIRLMRRR